MLNKLSMTPAVVLMAFLVSGCAGMTGGSDQLMNMITSQLGVTNNQAMGGVGSQLTLAKEKMGSMDFNALTKAISWVRYLYESGEGPWGRHGAGRR